MDIKIAEIREICIPFRFKYGHAKAKHQGVRSVICSVQDEKGNVGYGEAVPRAYVTGESTESIMNLLPSLLREMLPAASFDSFRAQMASVESDPAEAVPGCAFCALDLAVSDLAARQQNCSIGRLLCEEPADRLAYTASIGMGSKAKLLALLLLYKSLGFKRFKVKVGDPQDLERVRFIQRIFGRQVDLFADANGAWDRETAAARIEALAALGVWAIEEPLRVVATAKPIASGQLARSAVLSDEHFAANAWLQARSPIPMIADESLISLHSAKQIIAHQAFRIFNIRLSKCGGYLRSSQFAALAREAGLQFSVGAMVGESPVLAAAGMMFGAAEPEHLYIQGHSHRLLHGICFAEGCPAISRGAKLQIPTANHARIRIDTAALDRVTTRSEQIDL